MHVHQPCVVRERTVVNFIGWIHVETFFECFRSRTRPWYIDIAVQRMQWVRKQGKGRRRGVGDSKLQSPNRETNNRCLCVFTTPRIVVLFATRIGLEMWRKGENGKRRKLKSNEHLLSLFVGGQLQARITSEFLLFVLFAFCMQGWVYTSWEKQQSDGQYLSSVCIYSKSFCLWWVYTT